MLDINQIKVELASYIDLFRKSRNGGNFLKQSTAKQIIIDAMNSVSKLEVQSIPEETKTEVYRLYFVLNEIYFS